MYIIFKNNTFVLELSIFCYKENNMKINKLFLIYLLINFIFTAQAKSRLIELNKRQKDNIIDTPLIYQFLTQKIDTLPIPDNSNNDTFIVKRFHVTKYILTQSAINLKKGEDYFENNFIFLSQCQFGVTDYFSAGLGIVPNSSIGFPIFINTKFSFKLNNNFYLGMNSFFGTLGFGNEVKSSQYMLHQAILTYGDESKNFSISYGRYFIQDASNRLITFSAMLKARKNIFAFNEFIYTNDSETINFGGLRFMAKRYLLDIAAIIFQSDNRFIVIPYIGFKIRLSREKKI